MHFGKKRFAALIDEADFAQHDFDSMVGRFSLSPTLFQLLYPGSGEPSFKVKRDSLAVGILGDFQHARKNEKLLLISNRLAVYNDHKVPLELFFAIEQGPVHRDSLNAEAIEPTDSHQSAVAVVQLQVIH